MSRVSQCRDHRRGAVAISRSLLGRGCAHACWRMQPGRVRLLHSGVVVPWLRPLVLLALTVGVIVAVSMGVGRNASDAWRATMASVSNAGSVAAAMPMTMTLTATSPAYTGQPVREVREPDRIEVIEGSTVRVAATGAGSAGTSASAREHSPRIGWARQLLPTWSCPKARTLRSNLWNAPQGRAVADCFP